MSFKETNMPYTPKIKVQEIKVRPVQFTPRTSDQWITWMLTGEMGKPKVHTNINSNNEIDF